mmetsp:Transcript_27429/g.49400  ORF Transcript_27429/g.49400 Transcript_27429/m.49400 type:complete len:208 (+) Transcript_27429:269-892(+)
MRGVPEHWEDSFTGPVGSPSFTGGEATQAHHTPVNRQQQSPESRRVSCTMVATIQDSKRGHSMKIVAQPWQLPGIVVFSKYGDGVGVAVAAGVGMASVLSCWVTVLEPGARGKRPGVTGGRKGTGGCEEGAMATDDGACGGGGIIERVMFKSLSYVIPLAAMHKCRWWWDKSCVSSACSCTWASCTLDPTESVMFMRYKGPGAPEGG